MRLALQLPFILLVALYGTFAWGQKNILTLDSCWKLARDQYPLTRQLKFLSEATDNKISLINKQWIPQLSTLGQASYQSDVTSLSIKIPGLDLPDPLSKDQYKYTLELSQLVFDGLLTSAQKKIANANGQLEIQKTEVELYKLKERVMQIYFAALLMKEQLAITDFILLDLNDLYTKTEASFRSGVVLESQLLQVKAEILAAEQRKEELLADAKKWISQLGILIGRDIPTDIQMEVPTMPMDENLLSRPELALFDAQVGLSSGSLLMNKRQGIPKILLFGQVGYANPALNFLKNEFSDYYIAGVRFTWNLSVFANFSNYNREYRISKSLTDVQRENFLLQCRMNALQYTIESEKYKNLNRKDDELVALRKRIKEQSASQLDHGVITLNDYLKEVHAVDKALISARIHQIQFIQANYEKKYQNGL